MIRRLHAAAPAILALGAAIGMALTAVAQVAKLDYVTTGELHRTVLVTFLSGAGVVLAGLAWVYARDQRSRDRRADDAISAAAEESRETTRQIRELAGIVRAHHEDFAAHPAGSIGRVDRIEGKLDNLVEVVVGLRREHELIRETEMCLLRNPARRDPADSPKPRRADDPPREDFTKPRDDGQPWRGKP